MATASPYQHAEQMRTHWWARPGWRPGRRTYSWFLTFEGQPGLHRLVDQYRQQLRGVDGLDLVPPQWLHLTVQSVAFADDLTAGELDELIATVRDRLRHVAPATVEVQPATVWEEGIVLPVLPEGTLDPVRTAVRAGIASVCGPDRVRGSADGFSPHVTIAYNSLERDASDLVRLIDDLEPLPVTLDVDRVSLVEMDRDTRVYRWSSAVEAHLGAATDRTT